MSVESDTARCTNESCPHAATLRELRRRSHPAQACAHAATPNGYSDAMTEPASSPVTGRVVVEGTISSAAFGGGHRFVVGRWPTSPVGPMCDVMWATPTDRRILLAPTDEVAGFITQIYDFDEVRVEPLTVVGDQRSTTVRSDGLELMLSAGRRLPLLPSARPLAMTRWVESPIARALLGVHAYGTSPTGAIEWYQSSGLGWVNGGSARLDQRSIGTPQRLMRPLRVGFSEPPKRPSIVSVRVTIDLPDIETREP